MEKENRRKIVAVQDEQISLKAKQLCRAFEKKEKVPIFELKKLATIISEDPSLLTVIIKYCARHYEKSAFL